MPDETTEVPASEPTLQELAQQETEAQKADAQKTDAQKAEAAATEAGEAKPVETPLDDPATDDPKAIVNWFDETWGHKESDKHADDASFLRSVSEQLRMMGRKSDAEALGEKVQQHFAGRPDDILAFLDGSAPKPGAKQAAAEDADFDTSWVTTDDAGKVVPTPGAPADAMQRWGAHQQKLQQFAANPDKFIQNAVADRLKEIEGLNAQTRQEIEQQQVAADVNAVCERNRNLLWVEGDPQKGMTPQGEKALAFYEEYEAKIPDPVTRLELGCERALASAPKPSPRTVPSKATRKPGVATQPPKQKDSYDRFKEAEENHVSFAEIFQQIAQEQAANA